MKNISIITSAFFITACSSNIPTDNDIAKNINKSFENCKIAVIKDIKKTNGTEAENKNDYFVDLEFKLIFTEADNANNLKKKIDENIKQVPKFAEERIKKNETLYKIQQELNEKKLEEEESVLSQIQNRPIDPSNPSESLRSMQRDKNTAINNIKMKYAEMIRIENERVANDINNNPEEINNQKQTEEMLLQLNNINKKYRNSCLMDNKFITKTFFIPSVNLNNAYLGNEYHIEFKKIPMRKTENGWLFNL